MLNSKLTDPAYLVVIATQLTRVTKYSESEQILMKVIGQDGRNQDALNVLAFIYEQSGRLKEATNLREKIYVLNPWGADNLYQLALDYMKLNQRTEMYRIKNLLMEFASLTEYGKLAKEKLN